MKKAISAQNTKMYIENLNAAPIATGAITSASRSAPAYAVFDDASKLKDGAPIYITGTGWASLDNQEFVLQDLDPDSKSAALHGSDTTSETEDLSGIGMFQLNAFADVCARTYTINQTPATSIDTTTLCDDEKTSLVGFRDPGTLTFDFFIDPTDPDYLALLDAYDDGEERMFEIIYRNGAVRTLPVIVQSINETGGVDQAVAGSATLKITGAPVLTQPPGSQPEEQYSLNASAAPASGDIPLHVTLTINESGGVASKFAIDWDDGTAPHDVIGQNTATHDYTTAGSFTPSVTATKGTATLPAVDANVVTVNPSYSVTAAVAPTSGASPLDVTLTLTESNGTAEKFTVDWKDGGATEDVTGTTAPHTYSVAGVYSADITPTVSGTARAKVIANAVTVS
ncbi:hypothetical protein BG58_33095 [Caballeronia jiangsuensis]|nr:hypothetical protein BG58_33095 [Caballeronia jiangsuensis]